jgi:hypothetical protein
MHQTTAIRRNDKGFTIKLGPAPERGNLFRIEDQIGMAAAADKRRERRRIKAARKARRWKAE